MGETLDEVSDWYIKSSNNEYYVNDIYIVNVNNDTIELADSFLYLLTEDILIVKYRYEEYDLLYETGKNERMNNSYSEGFIQGFSDAYYNKPRDESNGNFSDYGTGFDWCLYNNDAYNDGFMGNYDPEPIEFSNIMIPNLKITNTGKLNCSGKYVHIPGQFVIENNGELICGTLEC